MYTYIVVPTGCTERERERGEVKRERALFLRAAVIFLLLFFFFLEILWEGFLVCYIGGGKREREFGI